MTRRSLLSLLASLTAGACGGGGGGPPGPPPPTASAIALVSGNNQAGTAGQALPQPLVVKVTSAAGSGVSGVMVAWTVTAGAGSVSAASVATDAQGLASVTWALGTVAGTDNNIVTASVSGLSGSPVTFTASATPGAASVALNGGDNQVGPAGQALPTPLSVIVKDASNNVVSGAQITWAAGTGGGSVNPTTSTTGTDGVASTTRTLGPNAGTQTATATKSGLTGSPVTFTSVAQIQGATQIALNGGNSQTGTVGTTLPVAYSVIVKDQNNNPVQGVVVSWSVPTGQGSVSAATSTSGASGIASATRTLGTTAGTQTAQASVTGLIGSPVSFTATATAGPAMQLAYVSGNNQTAMIGQNLAQPLVVVAKDQYGNVTSGVTVSWTTPDGGTLSPTSTTTNTQGQASTSWKLGPATGAQTAQASAMGLTGSPVTFTATATAAQVNMQNIAFNPATLTVTTGTTVTWVNKDGIVHTTTSDAGSTRTWDSGDMAGGATYSVTFSTPGTYPYHCRYHVVSYGMKGTIIVQ